MIQFNKRRVCSTRRYYMTPIKTHASEVDIKIRQLCKETTAMFWELICTLKVFKEHKLWEELEYDSFAQYLAQGEVSLKEKTVNEFITIYSRITSAGIPAQGLKNLPKSKAKLIAYKVTTENAEELVEKALTLSWSDLREEMKDSQPKTIPPFLKPPISWCEEHKKWWISPQDLRNMCTHK